MDRKMNVKIGASVNPHIDAAVDEIEKQTTQDEIKLLLFFASSEYQPERLAECMNNRFPEPLVVGCTSGGEISPNGFQQKGIVAAAFAGEGIDASAEIIPELHCFNSLLAQRAVGKCCHRLGLKQGELDPKKYFGMTLIDGLSFKEEVLLSALSLSLPLIKIVGGSAADDWKLKRTHIFLNGKSHTDAGLLILLKCETAFEIISRHHFLPTDKEFVVTKASPEQRMVFEINSKPASLEYARMLGMKPEQINTAMHDQYPFGFEVDDEFYIRSIFALTPKGLMMASAVNEGTILMLMKPGDMVDDTKRLIDNLKKKLSGEISAMVLFNCMGRHFEAEAKGITGDVFDILNTCPFIGFNTYGEQYCSLHINHSLTGVAFGK